mmetsp:Transcript_53621/g.170525  ORF Transcript_53621/g.170525 Transcript_53621/m.170525 type:complete len:304 (+) Transcript_53621:171-1082(+)
MGTSFMGEVSDPQKFEGKSVTYLVKVETDLPEYEGIGVGAPDGSGMRKIHIRRRYTDFEKLHVALGKTAGLDRVPLPKLPTKNFFNRFSDNVLEERRVAFQMLMDTAALHPALSTAPALVGFLSDIPAPDFEATLAEIKARAAEIAGTPDAEWEERNVQGGVTIYTRQYPGSDILSVKSSAVINAPLDEVYEMYCDTKEWRHWTQEMTFREVEEVEDGMGGEVRVVGYKLPVIDNRDTCVYSVKMAGLPGDPKAPGCRTIAARSVEHVSPRPQQLLRGAKSFDLIDCGQKPPPCCGGVIDSRG